MRIFLLFLFFISPFARAQETKIYIESMSNAANVFVVNAEGSSKVKLGQILTPGNHVQTKDSSARIIFRDGSAVTLGKNSELEIKTSEMDAKTEKLIQVSFLKNGFLHARVHHQADPLATPHFYIETSGAVAGVRGTEFTISTSADAKDFQMHVLEGKVAVALERTKIDDVPVLVSGELASAKAGTISPTEKFNLAEYRKNLSAAHAEVHKLIYNPIKTLEEVSVVKKGRHRR